MTYFFFYITYVIYSYVALPIGICLGIKEKSFYENQVKTISKKTVASLEEIYKSCKNPPEAILNVKFVN